MRNKMQIEKTTKPNKFDNIVIEIPSSGVQKQNQG